MKHTKLFFSAAAALIPGALSLRELRHRSAICGARGYDAGTNAYNDNKQGTYAACSAWCQKDSSCKSFAYGSGACYIYNVPVTGNFVADSGSPYLFYDRSCVSTSSTTAMTTATSTATTTAKSPSTTSKASSSAVKTSSSTTKAVTSSSTTSDCGGVPSTTTTTSKPATTTPTTKSATSPSTLSTKLTPSSSTTSKLTTKSSSITARAATSATPPCPFPTWVIHDFTFFNSSHNLDCAGADHDNHLCYTGLPPQPPGYGPPDYISVNIDGIGYCHQQNPGSVPLREVGNEVVRCGGSQIQLTFYGNSNSPSSTARFDLQNPVYCDNGCRYGASGSVNVPMNCVYDGGNNATCTINPGTVTVVPSTFGGVDCSSNDDSDDDDDSDDGDD